MTRSFAAFFLAFLLPAAALAETVLEQVSADAAASSADHWAVTRVYTDNRGETRHLVSRWDPRRSDGERWQAIARNGEPASPDYVHYYAAKKEAPPDTYAVVATYLANGAELLERTGGHALYRVDRLGAGSVLVGDQDVSAHMTAEIRIDTAGDRPFVEEVRMRVAEPFKPHWAASITKGEGVARFALDDDGRPVLVSQSFTAEGTKPFGRLVYETQSLYREHLYVGDAPAPADDERRACQSARSSCE